MKKGFWTVASEIINKSDLTLEILDARMPDLTRIQKLEEYAKKIGRPLLMVINKSDLVSKTTLKNIEEKYKDEYYIITSAKSSDCVKKIIKIAKIRIKKENIRIAVIGYPNTGKSSIINKLSKAGRARTSSESGFTKGLQLISGKSGLMLFDTPGVVPFADRDEIRLGLTSGISPEKLEDPESVAYELIKIFKGNNPEALKREYNINPDQEEDEILFEIGKNNNMLVKKGEVDEKRAAIKLLFDWHKGKIKL